MKAFLWLFLTATSAIVALLAVYTLLSMDYSQGPGGMFEGGIVLVALGALGSCVAVFIVSIRLRPAKNAFTRVNLLVSTGTYIAIVAFLWALPRSNAGYTLTVQVLDSAKRPIQGAKIKYDSFQLGSGLARFASPAKGRASTDGRGQVTIYTNHQHMTEGIVTKDGYRGATFMVDPEYSKTHVLRISWNGYHVPEQNFGYDVPADKQILLTIYLPLNSEGDNLPYTRNKQ